METLTKTEVPVLISYSMPFVLLSALVINTLLYVYGFSGATSRLIFLSGSFPIGFSVGRTIYLRWFHVRIPFDSTSFSVIKGSKEVVNGYWRSFRYVSIILDRYGKPNLRLHKMVDGEHVDLPISRTNAKPQEFRDYVQRLLAPERAERVSPRAVEAA